jgi:septal ring-binding cell division protein DamX
MLLLAVASLGIRPGRDATRAAAADPTPVTTPTQNPVAGSDAPPAAAAGIAPNASASAPPAGDVKASHAAAPATVPPTAAPATAQPAASSDASASTATHGPEKWTLHVASLQSLDSAQDLAAKLRAETGLPIHITPTDLESGVWYRVLLGEYPSGEAARAALESLRSKQDFAFVRTVRLAPSAEETP